MDSLNPKISRPVHTFRSLKTAVWSSIQSFEEVINKPNIYKFHLQTEEHLRKKSFRSIINFRKQHTTQKMTQAVVAFAINELGKLLVEEAVVIPGLDVQVRST